MHMCSFVCTPPSNALVRATARPCRDELRADLAEFEEKVDNITVSNPRVAQEYRWGGGTRTCGVGCVPTG
jgi:hypothetical protein